MHSGHDGSAVVIVVLLVLVFIVLASRKDKDNYPE